MADSFNAHLCDCAFVSALSQQETFSVHYVLDALAELQKTIIIFIFISVCLSVHMEQLALHWTQFHEI
jgi:hypothetical protein